MQQDELQISGDDIDFSGIDEDLEQFQQDDIVRQALLQGVDLRGYARDIDLELREVIGMDELLSVHLFFLILPSRLQSPLSVAKLAPVHHLYKCY